jgi:integrase
VKRKQPWPKVREVRHKNGTKAWLVDARIDGKGERFFFKAKGEADTKADQLRIQRRNEGTSALTMPAADRIDAESALAILAPHGRTLREAAEFFVRHLKIVDNAKTVPELVADLLRDKEQDEKSKAYLKDMRTRLAGFSRDFAESKIADITTDALDDWLRALPCAPISRNNTRRILRVLFNYAIKRGLLLESPAKNTSEAKVKDKPPGVLTPEQCLALLGAAAPEILPAIALGLFAGLRPEAEVFRLDWASVRFDDALIHVEAESTKSPYHRSVKMTPELVKWLLPYKKSSGPVSPTGDRYYSLLQAAREKAKISTWPPDALRHCFGSYHYAHHQNLGMAMAEMGHANPRTFLSHYRARVRSTDAGKYWKIVPANPKPRGAPRKLSPEKRQLPNRQRDGMIAPSLETDSGGGGPERKVGYTKFSRTGGLLSFQL